MAAILITKLENLLWTAGAFCFALVVALACMSSGCAEADREK